MSTYIWDYMNENSQNKEFQKMTDASHKQKRCLQVVEYPDAIVLPWRQGPYWGLGGIVDNKGAFVEQSRKVPQCKVASFFGSGYVADKFVESQDEVVYMGPFMHHWGHFLVDCLTRAWWLASRVNVLLSDAKILFLNIDDLDIDSVYLEFMGLFGVRKDRIVKITEPTRFKKVYLPDEAYIAGGFWTDEFKDFFQKAAQEAFDRYTGKCYEKIYLSRGRWKLGRQKGEFGENEIEKTFESNGFKIIYPEQLSVIEQIALIFSANEIVSPMGTVAHAVTLFASRARTLVICNKFYLHVPHQMCLNEMLDSKIIYIDEYYSKTPGIYWIGINKNMKRFFQDYDNRIPYSKMQLCGKYILNGIRYNLKKCMVPVYRIAADIRRSLLRRNCFGG